MLYFGDFFIVILIELKDFLDKIEVVNRLRKESAFETIKNYTIDYDKTWIFDKIQSIFMKKNLYKIFLAMKSINFALLIPCKKSILPNLTNWMRL